MMILRGSAPFDCVRNASAYSLYWLADKLSRPQEDFTIDKLPDLIHMPSIIEMTHLSSIKISHPWQIAPLFKAHFLQQLETSLIAFQDNRKDVPDPERRTSCQGVRY